MVASITRRLKRLVRDESGPTAVEYAVLLGLIMAAVIVSVRLVGTSSNSVFQSAADAFNRKTDGNPDGNGQY